MAMSKLPIIRPVAMAFRDVFNTSLAMSNLAFCALLIVVAVDVLEYYVTSPSDDLSFVDSAISFAFTAVQAFFLAPIMIAVHRLIVLGEITSHFRLDPRGQTFSPFVGWLLALVALGLFAHVPLQLAPWNYPTLALFSLIILIVVIVLAVVTARLSILLPAIAVEAPNATLSAAWTDSAGHGLRIFPIFLLTALPAAATLIAAGAAFIEFWPGEMLIPLVLTGALLHAAVIFLYVAVASRLFQALAHRLIGEIEAA